MRAANQDRYLNRHGADVVAHSGSVAWRQAGPSQEDHARRETMTAIHFADFAGSVPPGQPVGESMEAIHSVPQRHGVTLAGA